MSVRIAVEALQPAGGHVGAGGGAGRGGGAPGPPADGARRGRHGGRHGHAVHAPPAARARRPARRAGGPQVSRPHPLPYPPSAYLRRGTFMTT